MKKDNKIKGVVCALKRTLENSSGFSLIEVTVASFTLALISLALAQMNIASNKATNYVKIQQDVIEMRNQVSLALMKNCNTALVGQTANSITRIGPSGSSLIDLAAQQDPPDGVTPPPGGGGAGANSPSAVFGSTQSLNATALSLANTADGTYDTTLNFSYGLLDSRQNSVIGMSSGTQSFTVPVNVTIAGGIITACNDIGGAAPVTTEKKVQDACGAISSVMSAQGGTIFIKDDLGNVTCITKVQADAAAIAAGALPLPAGTTSIQTGAVANRAISMYGVATTSP